MTNERINAMLDSGDEGTLVDLNDWAVNTLREYARNRNRKGLNVMLSEEAGRIRRASLSLKGYLRARRAGSRFPLNRRDRQAVYAVVMTRALLA